MRPTARRDSHHNSLAARIRAKRRGGFTLVEMMVSVTLVLLMMMMFAEIYGLAQGMISKQKGIATNDQKARILSEVLRSDLESRTFREVYPFKCELEIIGTVPSPLISTVDPAQLAALQKRKGYFSYSENNPADPGDDVLQFTINVADEVYGNPGRSIFGKANGSIFGTNGFKDAPEYDDGRSGDASGASSMAEVSYYLRYGNLYRSVLLIRKPYLADTNQANWGLTTPFEFPGSPGAAAYTANESFWDDFDYSAYRENETGNIGLQFHGESSLSNNPSTAAPGLPEMLATPYTLPAGGTAGLFIPRTLAAPQLRFGHSVTLHGQPVEFGGTTNFDSSVTAVDAVGDGNGVAQTSEWEAWKSTPHRLFSRFNAQERSADGAGGMAFPAHGFGPFAGTPPAGDPDADNDGIVDAYSAGTRRGVDLMLPNVHSFDVQVWDDVVGGFVNLGHSLSGDNPYTDANNDGNLNNDAAEFGFYHWSRLRKAIRDSDVPGPFLLDWNDATVLPADFGNRYDTWCPNMYVYDGTTYFRNGRAPYRPLKTNPDLNPADTAEAAVMTAYERGVAFGDKSLADGTDAEAPLRAIRIVVRYLDPHSGQTRQATIEQSLIEN